jgi:hypothetical protein
MTAAHLLSSVEPIVRDQRGRFRGAEGAAPGFVRYEMGLQAREDALYRLVDVWAAGEAGASLAFAAARTFDELDALEKQMHKLFEGRAAAERRAGVAEEIEDERLGLGDTSTAIGFLGPTGAGYESNFASVRREPSCPCLHDPSQSSRPGRSTPAIPRTSPLVATAKSHAWLSGVSSPSDGPSISIQLRMGSRQG